VDAAARRHGAGVDQETTDERIAYARFPELHELPAWFAA
jgi:hypothetical protein